MVMFTRRHEQELAEIKAHAQALNRSAQEGLAELARINEAQNQGETPGREESGPFSNYLDLLDRLHGHLRPRTYVEIGIGQGRSLARARPETLSVGIDPRPKLSNPYPAMKIFELTSDDFFGQHDLHTVLDGRPVDFAFIDGLHAFEFALRDFRNLERFCGSDSTIVMHDCYPKDDEAALREDSKAFQRGVWKLILCLKEYRPDLRVVVVEVPPTGLGIVTHLDPASRVLEERYDEIRERFADVGYDQVAHSKREKLNLVPADWNTVESILAERPSRDGGA